ncbi:putative adenylyl-sulfate kinase [Magnetospirillum sp. XM-1]|uniref:adenylyl-sulfate kinase n=1 Tax=Magnetospirillum sp. XM-1 TaxID=1663591 RepID=UPI00073DE54F|nr:adenylyl-sulfate kinase [Magnetospirillum sp. XM-1]CUW37998.1 putative adenylyl-sulfate kinase [Magnetospirillum sp. XM-1]
MAQNPGNIWIAGLSSAGKSTLARLLVNRLEERGYPCMLLDGDEVRSVFPERLGYDPESRRRQTGRVMALAKLIARQGILPIVAIIHPFEEDRRRCREELENYVEVYLRCPIEECRRRDTKSVYAEGADAHNVVGVDIPYETPTNPTVVFDSGTHSPGEMLEELWEVVQERILPRYPLRIVKTGV